MQSTHKVDKFIRLKALVTKEFFQIVRDPSTIVISVILPMLLLFLYCYGVNLDLDHLRIGIVMEDTAPDAQSLVQSFTDSRYFDAKIWRDRHAVVDEITRGSIRGFVVIPSYFSEFRAKPSVIAPIQVIADGSEPNTANFVQNYVQSAYSNWLQQEAISSNLTGLSLVQAQPRYWYNEELQSRFFLLPGSLAIIITLIGTLLTALVVSREWERGTMESLMATPVGIFEIIMGKMIPYFMLGMISVTICVIVSVFVYDLPLRGSVLVLGFVSATFLFCALSLGLLLSTLSKNQVVATQLALIMGFMPAYMLSGFIFEIASMPTYIQIFTYIVPARYFVQCLQTLFLVGNVWELILFNTLAMLVFGIIIFLITAKVTVKRLD